jgi:catechol 2,3-dioxygenase-like lactoylglutathione lyase family enzyme/heme-degrading monooxygenase HmoA
VIARIWRGWTRTEDADAYLDYLQATGIPAYRSTPGNRAAYVLRRADGERTEFATLTLWSSFDAVKAFAGDDVEQAVFYPEDDRFLVDRETTATHFDVFEPYGVQELRVALTADDYDQALAFYRDGLGLAVEESWDRPDGRGAILPTGRATLEVLSTAMAETVDRIEAGDRVSGPVRLAIEVPDPAAAGKRLVEAGADPVGGPVETPWGDGTSACGRPTARSSRFLRLRDRGQVDEVPVGILEEGELLTPLHLTRSGDLPDTSRDEPFGGGVGVVRIDAELERPRLAALRPVRKRRHGPRGDPDPGLAQLEEGELELPLFRPAKGLLEAEVVAVEARGALGILHVEDRKRLSKHARE